jgi:hypothetical protein
MENTKNKKKAKDNWIIKAFILTFILAIGMSIISEGLIKNVHIALAFLILIVIVSIGVIFDTIGIAVAVADEKPFHAMASKKIPSAKYGVLLIKNASKVSNVCNDVVGDIAGIISGAAATTITISIIAVGVFDDKSNMIIPILLSAAVASLTVGGKAIGKEVAMKKSKSIVNGVAVFLYVLDKKLHIKILK